VAPEAASDLPDQVRPVEQREQRELRRRLCRGHHSPNRNVVVRLDDDQPRRQMPVMVLQDRFRRRVASEDLNVNDSAHRRLPAQVKVSSAVEVRRLECINR